MRIVALQNCAAEGFGRYTSVLTALGAELTVVAAYEQFSLPSVERLDAVLVGGTPIPAYEADEHPFLRAEMAFLENALEAGIPCLGVCFGAQLLARMLGAAVQRAETMEIGGYDVTLTVAGTADPLMEGFPATFPVFHWHGDTFTVPPGGALLAEGRGCANQMFRCDRVVGLQFHLETTAAETAAWADEYAGELASVGKNKQQVVQECRDREPQMAALATRLMANFLEEVP